MKSLKARRSDMLSSYATNASLAVFIVCSILVQLFLKLAGNFAVSNMGLISSWLLNPYLWATPICLGVALIFWRYTLMKRSLSSAYPWTALVYVATPFLAHLLWEEVLSSLYWAGIFLIILGIIITTRSSA